MINRRGHPEGPVPEHVKVRVSRLYHRVVAKVRCRANHGDPRYGYPESMNNFLLRDEQMSKCNRDLALSI